MPTKSEHEEYGKRNDCAHRGAADSKRRGLSMLKDLKKAIGMMRGVTKITIPRRKRLSSYERSLRDLDEGRVYKYDSLDDLIKEIEG